MHDANDANQGSEDDLDTCLCDLVRRVPRTCANLPMESPFVVLPKSQTTRTKTKKSMSKAG